MSAASGREWSCRWISSGEVWTCRSLPRLLWTIYCPRWWRRIDDLAWRLRESPKEYRYGGLRAALRWIFKGVSADADA